MCHIRKYVIFWYEKKKVEAFSFFFHIFIKKDGRRRDRDISIEIQMKLDILPFQKRSSPQPLLLLLQSITFSKKKCKKEPTTYILCCCCPQWAKIWKRCNLGKPHCLPQRYLNSKRVAPNGLGSSGLPNRVNTEYSVF